MIPKALTSKELPCQVTAGACILIDFPPQTLEGVQFVGRRLPQGWEVQPLIAGELRLKPVVTPEKAPQLPPFTPDAGKDKHESRTGSKSSNSPQSSDAESWKQALLQQLARIQQMLNEID